MIQCPLVILLDIDGTLIGDITPQVMLYEIVQSIGKSTKLKYDIQDLRYKLKEGIVRPGFFSFFKTLTNYGVEFFIYTASEKKWATFLVNNIEKGFNVKFNRPIFTRDNCIHNAGEYKKSFQYVIPKVYQSLKKKYRDMTLGSLKHNILAIDNNDVYLENDRPFVLQCSTYACKIPVNIPSYVDHALFAQNAQYINEIMSKFFTLKQTSQYMKFQKQFYMYYIDCLSSYIKNKEQYAKDSLFKSLQYLIISKKINVFNEGTVKYLQSKIE